MHKVIMNRKNLKHSKNIINTNERKLITMNRLEKVLDSLCPNGVEYKELNTVCRFQNGFAFKSKLFSESGLPILRITNISEGKLSEEGYVYFNPNDYKENLSNYIVKPNSIVVAMSGATTGKIGYNYSPKEYYLNQRVGMFLPDESFLLNRYLYHWLSGQSGNILAISSGTGSQPNLSSVKMMKFKIPVPPLEVQHEIIRILDSFMLLTAELTAELTARRKQFEYYRNQLISVHNNNVHSNKLSEIASIYDGTHQTPKYQETGIPFVSVENIENIYDTDKYISLEEYNLYKVKPQLNDLFMTRIGTVGKCAIVNKLMDLAYYVSLALIRPDSKIIDTRYLKYYIESSLGKKELSKRILHHAVPVKINKEDIGKIMISYPELSIQKKIADLLDNFESICADLDIGLPAEIEARKIQYEFYRDHLLTFVQTGHSILTDRQTESN